LIAIEYVGKTLLTKTFIEAILIGISILPIQCLIDYKSKSLRKDAFMIHAENLIILICMLRNEGWISVLKEG